MAYSFASSRSESPRVSDILAPEVSHTSPPSNSSVSVKMLVDPVAVKRNSLPTVKEAVGNDPEAYISDSEKSDCALHRHPSSFGDYARGFETDARSTTLSTDFLPLNNKERYVSFNLSNGHKMIVRFRQQPQRSRMIGFAEKDRRPIDPPPVLELICLDNTGKRIEYFFSGLLL